MTALTDLIARIEKADDDDINSRIAAAFPEILLARHIHEFENCHSFSIVRGGGVAYRRGDDPYWRSVSSGLIPDFIGSLDAAAAFVEAVLPEAKKLIREEAKDWVTTHWRAVLELPKPPYTMVGDAPTPALALVLAALRAHAAKETT